MSSSLLESVNSPDDLKQLDLKSLNQLAEELRTRIIEVMSVNGGHLASNLGTVELTLALHKVFDTPNDKLIWDVGHQSYSHKILTGRRESFSTIRQYKGLCGFTHPHESKYDHFHAGHAGTALSQALGVAKARDIQQAGDYVIPIIGDATLTCGTALEALNNMSRELKRFIVILNDNKMSISTNVGAITHILSRILSNPTSNKVYQEIDSLVSKIPTLGDALSNQGRKITESIKNLVSPASFFEHYGLSYIGPIDGHDTKKLIDCFNGVKDSQWPVLIHVVTEKGHGMEEAEKDPISYHGAKPFSLETCKFLPAPSKSPTFPKVFGKHMVEMAKRDPKIVAVTPAMPAGSCLVEMMKEFPDRCIDVGIAESHAGTFCGGLAYGGMKVVFSIYSTFMQRAFDNIFHDICLQELPAVFAIDRGGIAGGDGSSHNGIYDISFLNAMPNMVIAQPRNGQVLRELMDSAFSYERPTAIRYPNLTTEIQDVPLAHRTMGRGEVLAKGSDLTIMGLGHMAYVALDVREKLLEHGISATVLDPVFIKPLDHELLCQNLGEHGRLVTLEEHSLAAGFGSIVNHYLMSHGYQNLSVLNIGVPETFVEQGSHSLLMDELGLTPAKITERILSHYALKTHPSPLASVKGE